MKFKWRRTATTLGFVSCLAMLAPACIIAARNPPPPPPARAQPVSVVNSKPPAPRYKRVRPRAGHVWVRGHYEFRNRWVWVPGHWERARRGKVWEPGHWDRRGNQWRWTRGRWVAARGAVRGPVTAPGPRAPGPRVRDHRGAHPTVPPPAPRVVRQRPRPGFVWIPGHYNWRAGQYVWVKGHWERARKGSAWVRGRWVKRGGHYVWVKGKWNNGPVRVRDHRRRRR